MPHDDPETLVRLLQASDADVLAMLPYFRTQAIADLRAWLDEQASARTPREVPAPPGGVTLVPGAIAASSPEDQADILPVAPDVPRTHVSMAMECDAPQDAPQDTPPALSFLTGDEVLAYRRACTPVMTQEALGALLGVKGQEVSKWENKKKAIPPATEAKLRALMAQQDVTP